MQVLVNQGCLHNSLLSVIPIMEYTVKSVKRVLSFMPFLVTCIDKMVKMQFWSLRPRVYFSQRLLAQVTK